MKSVLFGVKKLKQSKGILLRFREIIRIFPLCYTSVYTDVCVLGAISLEPDDEF